MCAVNVILSANNNCKVNVTLFYNAPRHYSIAFIPNLTFSFSFFPLPYSGPPRMWPCPQCPSLLPPPPPSRPLWPQEPLEPQLPPRPTTGRLPRPATGRPHLLPPSGVVAAPRTGAKRPSTTIDWPIKMLQARYIQTTSVLQHHWPRNANESLAE